MQVKHPYIRKAPYVGSVQAVIFDWAGTTVDYGCFAPVKVFVEIFKQKGVDVTIAEARKPMGMVKKDHIRVMCQMDRIARLWQDEYGTPPAEEDVEALYARFEPSLLAILPDYADPLPGVVDTVARLREMDLEIGSTTGYLDEMMAIVAPAAEARGYAPDCLVTSSAVPAGRPYPWMVFQNAIQLGVYPMEAIVKVGDTVADVQEGLNAGAWSVGVVMGSSVLGLSAAEVDGLAPAELEARVHSARETFRRAGAHYVVDQITDLPALVETINRRLAKGDMPTMPRNPYLLLTPGPISTSPTVKQVMLTDWGSRNDDYKGLVEDVRRRLVHLATATRPADYTAILVQGSGTFVVESVIGTAIPPDGKLLVLANGAYGTRIKQMAEIVGVETVVQEAEEFHVPDLVQLRQRLASDPAITHVACIHSETTTGIINPLVDIARVVKAHDKVFIVDAMSSFGAVPLDVAALDVDFLVSSPNKNLQGVPGFAFIIGKVAEVEKCAGRARSLSLDFHDQWARMERTPGSFRFTSPVHVIRAFHQALVELEEEGGVAARHARYARNQEKLVTGMRDLGFRPIPIAEYQGPIITTFYSPADPAYDFERFYALLQERGLVIYPGKTTKADTFRIGTIGEIYPADIERLLRVVQDVMFWDNSVPPR